MKHILIGTLAAFALSACASTVEETAAPDAMAKMECAVMAPDGNCACKKVDENGDCVEGGGTGVIVRGGNN